MENWFSNLKNSVSTGSTSLWNKTKELGQSVKNKFSSSSQSIYGGKTRKARHSRHRRKTHSRRIRKMKGGNAPVPYCPKVWSNESPFPEAVGGKKMKGGYSDCSTTAPVPYCPSVWSVGAPVGGKKHRKKHNKKIFEIPNLTSELIKIEKQTSKAAIAASSGKKTKRKN
jgi:hypothetical protein